MNKLICSASLLCLGFGTACALELPETTAAQEGDITGMTSLAYERSCSWLQHCSKPSIAAGKVSWGCRTLIPSLDSQVCADSMAWVAVPSSDYCGLPIHICNGSKCVDAQGWDISNKSIWEGSPGVMTALGLSHSENLSTCSGSGGGTVTLSKGTWADYASTTLNASQSNTFTFAPGKSGTHAIEFINNSTISSAGTIQFCWRAGTGNWNCWATNPVTNQYRRQILYSGSPDINYKFTFTNTVGKSATFFRRFYTGW